MNISVEFDRQVRTLITKEYHTHAQLDEATFIDMLMPLKEKLSSEVLIPFNLEQGTLPFVIVIKKNLVRTDHMMSLVMREGKEGISKLYPHFADEFETIREVTLPEDLAYLLLNVDRGKDTINLSPQEGFIHIQQEDRLPLTIEEGIAVVTHFPEFLIKNNCFYLLGSRKPESKSVPAIWINSKKHPNLGWCWFGNPHTWLGTASCGHRVGLGS